MLVKAPYPGMLQQRSVDLQPQVDVVVALDNHHLVFSDHHVPPDIFEKAESFDEFRHGSFDLVPARHTNAGDRGSSVRVCAQPVQFAARKGRELHRLARARRSPGR